MKKLTKLSPDQESKLVEQIKERYDTGAAFRRDQVATLEFNRLMYRGDQWLVNQLGKWTVAEKKPWKIRLSVNLLPPAIEGNISVFMRAKPIIGCVPLSDGDDDRRRARVDEALLRSRWQTMGMESKLLSMLLWFFVGGNGFMRVRWDKTKGKKIALYEMQEVFDEVTGEVEQVEVETGEFANEGESTVDVIDPFSIQVEPGAVEFEDCAWCLITEFQRRGEVELMYDIDLDDLKGSTDTSIAGMNITQMFQPVYLKSNSKEKQSKDRIAVHQMYERPSRKNKNGRYVVMAEDRILVDEELPNGEIRIVHFKCVELPGEFWALGLVDAMAQSQMEYNRSRSQLVENRNLTTRPKMLSPSGALQADAVTSEPGEIIEYEVSAGGAPHYLNPPQMPAFVSQELMWMRQDMDDLSSRHEASQGKMSGTINSAKQADAFAAADTSRYLPHLLRFEEKLERLGYYVLVTDKENMTGEQAVAYVGKGLEVDVQHFMMEEVEVNCRVKMEIVSQIPWDRDQLRQTSQYLYQIGAIDVERLRELLDEPTSTNIYRQDQDEKQNAQIENELLLGGEKFDPLPTDDHRLHLKYHTKAANRPENRTQYLKSREILNPLYAHMELHKKQIPAPQPPPIAPKLNISARDVVTTPEGYQTILGMVQQSAGAGGGTPNNPPEDSEGGRAPGMSGGGGGAPPMMATPEGGVDGQMFQGIE